MARHSTRLDSKGKTKSNRLILKGGHKWNPEKGELERGVLGRHLYDSLHFGNLFLMNSKIHQYLDMIYPSSPLKSACLKYFMPTHATTTHTHAITHVKTSKAG